MQMNADTDRCKFPLYARVGIHCVGRACCKAPERIPGWTTAHPLNTDVQDVLYQEINPKLNPNRIWPGITKALLGAGSKGVC